MFHFHCQAPFSFLLRTNSLDYGGQDCLNSFVGRPVNKQLAWKQHVQFKDLSLKALHDQFRSNDLLKSRCTENTRHNLGLLISNGSTLSIIKLDTTLYSKALFAGSHMFLCPSLHYFSTGIRTTMAISRSDDVHHEVVPNKVSFQMSFAQASKVYLGLGKVVGCFLL